MPTPQIPNNPLGDPKAFRGFSTKLKEMAVAEKRSDFLPPFEKSFPSFVLELAKIVLVALAIVIPIRFFILQPFTVRGASMEPNFHDNEYLIIDEISYRLHPPRRGDVVVLHNPSLTTEFFIKRVIGLPGERVVVTDGTVRVFQKDGTGGLIDESAYLPAGRVTFGDIDVTLASDEVYLLGDNRPASLDSRSFGPIKLNELVGRTAIRAWPITKAAVFATPTISIDRDSNAVTQ
jgi:signal peptidase I